MASNTAIKAIRSYRKHERLVHEAVQLGKAVGLAVDATDKNDARGDIRVATIDQAEFLAILGHVIDKRQAERGRCGE